MREIWRDIPDWPYQVSNLGRIRRVESHRILSPCIHQDFGYYFIVLHKKLDRRIYRHWTVYLHRLVAKVWMSKRPRYHQIHHIDNNKLNNVVSNLTWVTQSENIQFSYDHDERIRRNGKHCTLEQYGVIKTLSKIGLSQVKIGEALGFDNSTISRVLNGKIQAARTVGA